MYRIDRITQDQLLLLTMKIMKHMKKAPLEPQRHRELLVKGSPY
jgi:hypothetical protein